MSSFLILLRPPQAAPDAGSPAFDVAAQRLRSRRDGDVRTGANGCCRWAIVADPSELSVTADRLSVVDAVPYMVEHRAAADGERLTGVALDLRSASAVLSRDRFGAKPLFYAPLGDGWAVASEAKALTPFIRDPRLNPVALSDAVNFRWVLGEDFLVDPVRQVLPGAEVRLTPGAQAHRGEPALVRFEPDSDDVLGAGWYRAQAEAALRSALRSAAGAGELAIPLSGGIDSSVLAALAKSEGLPVRGYILRYEGHPNPEYQRARTVAQWLGIETEEVSVAEADVAAILPDILCRLEQPPRHINNVAFRRLYDAIRRRGGVVVHGDGAEMMFGLADHHRVRQFAGKRRLVELVLGGSRRSALARLMVALPGNLSSRMSRLAATDVPGFARRLDEVTYDKRARPVLDLLCRGREPCRELSALLPDDRPPAHEELQTYQIYTFLQCCLVRLDRLASPLGLSVAEPFLAREVVDVARRVPTALKSRGAKGKPILRDICSRYLPREVAEWPKMGFASPDREWIMGPATAERDRTGAWSAEAWRLAITPDQRETLLRLNDHETRFLLIALEGVLARLGDRDAAEPAVTRRGGEGTDA